MPKFHLSRRALLRGAGGAVVALPSLEAMFPRMAHAAPPPRRFIVTFMGSSLGGDGDPVPNLFVPNKVGKDYDIKKAIEPLRADGLSKEVSVVSGLRVPSTGDSGYAGNFHAALVATMLTGRRNGSDSAPLGTSADEIVADHAAFKDKTRFRSLRLRVQLAGYAGGPHRVRDSISYKNGVKQGMQASVLTPTQTIWHCAITRCARGEACLTW